MVLKKITYKIEDKNYLIEAKIVDTPLKKFFGLMFKKNSPPLLFTFNKEKDLSIDRLDALKLATEKAKEIVRDNEKKERELREHGKKRSKRHPLR